MTWGGYRNADFYRMLARLKASHPALANGESDGPIELLDAGDTKLFAFRRTKGNRPIMIVPNISNETVPSKALSGVAAQTISLCGHLSLDSNSHFAIDCCARFK
jgi:hypothetical protein